jgi:hypothetical protein
MMFNTYIRDGVALECEGDGNQGFLRRWKK